MAQGNFGNPEQHAEAGREGGKASGGQDRGRDNNEDKGFMEAIGMDGDSGDDSRGQFKENDEWTQQQAQKGGESSGDGR